MKNWITVRSEDYKDPWYSRELGGKGWIGLAAVVGLLFILFL